MPKDLPTVETSAVKKAIIYQKFKSNVTKEASIKDNKYKMYEIYLGQCTDALQIMIAYDMGYKEEEKNKYLIWILKTIKEISSGLDKFGNESVTNYNALKSIVLMGMGKTESEDSYVKIFHSIIKTLIPDGRKGYLCCIKTLVAK